MPAATGSAMRHRLHAAPARAAARGTRVRRERRHGTGLWRSHRASMEVIAHGDKLRENRCRVDAAKCRTPVGAGIPMAGCASARREDGDGQPECRGRPGFLLVVPGGDPSGHAALCPLDAFALRRRSGPPEGPDISGVPPPAKAGRARAGTMITWLFSVSLSKMTPLTTQPDSYRCKPFPPEPWQYIPPVRGGFKT